MAFVGRVNMVAKIIARIPRMLGNMISPESSSARIPRKAQHRFCAFSPFEQYGQGQKAGGASTLGHGRVFGQQPEPSAGADEERPAPARLFAHSGPLI